MKRRHQKFEMLKPNTNFVIDSLHLEGALLNVDLILRAWTHIDIDSLQLHKNSVQPTAAGLSLTASSFSIEEGRHANFLS